MLRPFLLLIIFFFTTSGDLFSQSDTVVINRLNARAWNFRHSDLDSSLLLGNRALTALHALPKQKSFPKQWKEKTYVKTHYYLSFFYSQTGQVPMAFDHLDTALDISNKINYDYGRSLVNTGLGLAYQDIANFPKALDYFFKALQINEKLGIKEGIAVNMANIGNVYAYQKDEDKALEYYTKALKLGEELKDRKRIALQLGNIGNIYYDKGELAKAKEFYNKSLAINMDMGNKNGTCMNLSNLASVFQQEHDYAKALDYYNRARQLAEELGNQDFLATFIGNIGSLYLLLKDYKKAEQYLNQALAIFYELHSLEAIQEFENALSTLYTESGNDKLAFDHYKKYEAAKDSIFNTLNTEKSVRSAMNYEFNKKQDAAKAKHEKEIIAFEAENKLQKQLHLFMLVVIVLILAILFFMKRAYDNKKRVAGFLESESQRKEVLLQEVHHRINNNLQIISSLLSLQAGSAKDERLNEFLKQSLNRIQSLSVMHELLYQNDSMLEINMSEYLEKVLSFHRDVLSTRSGHVNLATNIASVSFPTKTAVSIALIVNELVTNSIKYAFDAVASGTIEISLLPEDERNDKWMLRVSDNGKGLPVDNSARKDSLGLRLVNIMVKQMNALYTKDNTQGASFTVQFSLNA